MIQNIVKESKKQPLCCVDFVITDVANNSFSHAMELEKEYDSVILTIGSQKGTLAGIEGEDAENVFSGIDFLREILREIYETSGANNTKIPLY